MAPSSICRIRLLGALTTCFILSLASYLLGGLCVYLPYAEWADRLALDYSSRRPKIEGRGMTVNFSLFHPYLGLCIVSKR